jgi:hypothetical protein
MAKPLNPSIT